MNLHPVPWTLSWCAFSVLMLVLLSGDEPADAVCSQDGVEGEASDEEHREDQQPVDALHWHAGEGAQVVCIQHLFVRGSVKTCSRSTENTEASVTHQVKDRNVARSKQPQWTPIMFHKIRIIMIIRRTTARIMYRIFCYVRFAGVTKLYPCLWR